MTLLEIKGRLARAFVEAIFRRAGYAVTPSTQREVPPRLGRADLPDFVARRASTGAGGDDGAAWLVEARYRPRLAHYLAIEQQRGALSWLAQLKRNWPDLLVALLTDYPDPGRSAFQVIDLAKWRVGEPVPVIDLFAHPELAIFQRNVEEHEELVRRVLTLFEGDERFRPGD